MSIAQIMGEERRPVGEVLLDSVAIVDKLQRDAATLVAQGQVSADQIERLVESARLANHMSYVAVKAGATEALVQERQRNLARESDYVTSAVSAVVDGLEDHMLALGIDSRHVAALRTWAFEAAASKLEDGEPPALPPVPVRAVRASDVDLVDDHDDGDSVREEDDQPGEHGAAWLRVVDADDDASSDSSST
jgi:hypothetical protein